MGEAVDRLVRLAGKKVIVAPHVRVTKKGLVNVSGYSRMSPGAETKALLDVVRGLDDRKAKAVAGRLTENILGGWIEPGDDISGDELADLIGDAIDQHEEDDPDYAPGERRRSDNAIVRKALHG